MTDPQPDSTTPEATRTRLSTESFSRIAEQVAREGGHLPVGLDPDQEQDLIALIRRLQRDRLIRHIARFVARDLLRDEDGTSPPRKGN